MVAQELPSWFESNDEEFPIHAELSFHLSLLVKDRNWKQIIFRSHIHTQNRVFIASYIENYSSYFFSKIMLNGNITRFIFVSV